jgi:hypothetical protein
MSISRCLLVAALMTWPVRAIHADDGPGFVLPQLPGTTPTTAPVLGPEPILNVTSPGVGTFDARPEREPLRANITNAGLLGSLSSQQTVRDGDTGAVWGDPLAKRGWQSDQSWKLNVAGPIFVFGQASAAAEDALQQDTHVNGRTGLGWQMPVPIGELLLRGGTNTTYSDILRPNQVKERSELLLEVKGRCPLLFGINLEFDGTACPGLSPVERDWVSHEVRLALPVGTACKLKLGARQRWENLTEQRAISDGTQLFLGVELNH